MSDLSLIVNTVTKNKDIWPMFFGQLKNHTPPELFKQIYVFIDEDDEDIDTRYKKLIFDKNKLYRDQFVSCIQHVEEEYCVYISEDYILYDDIQGDLIRKYIQLLENNKALSFIRFMKGGVTNVDYPLYKDHDDLYEMHHGFPYFYTNQAAIWRTRDLEKIHVHGPNLHIGNHDWQNSFEFQATRTCQQLDIQGLFCYHGEPKRGVYHYDCKVFPHISTALIKGKWNINEYPEELNPLLQCYNIDIEQRGVSSC